MRVETLPYIQNQKSRLADLENIFWLTATKNPTDPDARKKFFYKYCGVYIEQWPDDVYLAINDETNETMGYLIGCRDSVKAIPTLDPLLNFYRLFEDLYKKYPAHLHMDVHPKFQGHGVGTFLFGQFRSDLESARVKGLHILNSPDAKSVQFYRRCGLLYEVIRQQGETGLLFMGATF